MVFDTIFNNISDIGTSWWLFVVDQMVPKLEIIFVAYNGNVFLEIGMLKCTPA